MSVHRAAVKWQHTAGAGLLPSPEPHVATSRPGSPLVPRDSEARVRQPQTRSEGKKKGKLGRGKQGSDDLCLPVAPPMSNGRPPSSGCDCDSESEQAPDAGPLPRSQREVGSYSATCYWRGFRSMGVFTLLPSMSVAAAKKKHGLARHSAGVVNRLTC